MIGTPVQTPPVEVAISIENERDKAELENNEKVECDKSQTAESDKDNLGQLVFKLRYRSEQNALAVTVVKCKGLPARGQQNATSDPYVKLQLLPEKQHHVKTRVLRNTRDPVYDEDFTFFGISQSQLQVNRTPWIFAKRLFIYVWIFHENSSGESLKREITYLMIVIPEN